VFVASPLREAVGRVPGAVWAWAALVLLLLVALPLFVRLPLWLDITWYGICAGNILHGGVLERDLNVFFRPPLMAWLLAAVRGLVGWHASVLRLLDFALVSANVWLLVHWPAAWRSRTARVWVIVLLFAFYFSTSESCHCQPDMWMLVPALVALHLRRRHAAALVRAKANPAKASGGAFLEGLCWGIACLVKPFVIVPGVICCLLAAVRIGTAAPRPAQRLAADTIGLLLGGLAAGGIWVAWLVFGQGWPYFWNDLRIWGGEYYKTGPTVGARLLYLFKQFPPWGWVQLVALPLALAAVVRVLTTACRSGPRARDADTADSLLAGFFLGWFWQANFLQFQYDYHLAPVVLLALTLVAGQRWFLVDRSAWNDCQALRIQAPAAWALLFGLLGFAAARHPMLNLDRLALWGQCLSGRHPLQLRDALAIETLENPPNWGDLDRVADFLRAQKVTDGEVTCHGQHTIHLYLDLDIAPSTRLILLSVAGMRYPDHQELIHQELRASRQRYVVTDLREVDCFLAPVTVAEPGEPLALPADFPPELAAVFPWSEKIVFRAGAFLVHEVRHAAPDRDTSTPVTRVAP
jgi:hypothetical protein